MAEKIGNYIVYSSNASKKGAQKASVTVRDSSGQILARIYSERSQPLRWIRKWPHSEERLEIVKQLKAYGVPPQDINAIISM